MEQTWRRLYEAAILETDGAKISDRISAAKEAIRARMQELSPDASSREEQESISSALSGLGILEAEIRGNGSQRS